MFTFLEVAAPFSASVASNSSQLSGARKGRAIRGNFFRNASITQGMYYVYILRREVDPTRHYVGATSNLRRRVSEHNRGDSVHTASHRPWILINYFAFLNKAKVVKFERYLKSGRGRRFQRRHFG